MILYSSHCACAIHEVLCALFSQLAAIVIVAESDAYRAVVGARSVTLVTRSVHGKVQQYGPACCPERLPE